jgi:hypothetical protein
LTARLLAARLPWCLIKVTAPLRPPSIPLPAPEWTNLKATPATCGAAMLVPLFFPHFPSLSVEMMSVPGAATCLSFHFDRAFMGLMCLAVVCVVSVGGGWLSQEREQVTTAAAAEVRPAAHWETLETGSGLAAAPQSLTGSC